MTVLIANTAINIAIFAVSYVAFDSLASTRPLLAACGGVIALVSVILFGEILPKALALSNPAQIAPLVAPFIHALQIVTTPLRNTLAFLFINPISRLLYPNIDSENEISSKELHHLVELSAEQEIITSREHDMLQAVVALPELTVRSIMVPRVDISALSVDASRADAYEKLRKTRLKKIPVYGRDLDDIRGILYAKDFLLNPERKITTLLQPPKYVPEIANLLQLLDDFQNSKSQLAIAVDEYGGVSGLVTLEDILEEIVGELDQDITLTPSTAITKMEDGTFRISGAMSIRPWRGLLGLTDTNLPIDTIGGFVLARLGRAPRIGDILHVKNISLAVECLQGRRIISVILRIEPTRSVEKQP